MKMIAAAALWALLAACASEKGRGEVVRSSIGREALHAFRPPRTRSNGDGSTRKRSRASPSIRATRSPSRP